MKNFVIIAAASLFSGCYIFYHPGYDPPPGILYENAVLSRHISTPTELGSRIGMSCIVSYAGLVTNGDASVHAAAASKGIKTVKAVDYRKTSVLAGIYTKLCTIVYGD